NRRRPPGWLPPSLRSRIGNVLSWATRYQRWVPLVRIDVERVNFDTTFLHNPYVSGIEYQRGELAGWEIRSYLLEKFGRTCVYCGRGETAFEVDHIRPRSRGGTSRVSNLALSCHACNAAKADQTAAEFGHPEVEAQARRPLKDAAAMNASRYALCDALRALGLPLTSLVRRANSLESRSFPHRESALSGCAVRRPLRGGRRGHTQNAGDQSHGSRTLLPHQCG